MNTEVLLRISLEELESSARGLSADAMTLSGMSCRVSPTLTHWSGAAASAATLRLDELALELRRLSDVVRACAQLLSATATALRPARAELMRAASGIAAFGLRLEPDGDVVLPPMVATPASTLARSQAATAATALAKAALAAAAEADHDAAAALHRRGGALRPFLSAAPRALGDPHPLWPVSRGPFGSHDVALAALFVRPVLGPVLPDLDDVMGPVLIPTTGTSLSVAAWWSVLPADARFRLLASQPAVIGRLDGIPMQSRHEANVLLLQQEWARVAGGPSFSGEGAAWALRGHQSDAARRHGMLRAVAREMAAGSDRRLVTLDVDQGLAAIALGELDSAAHIAVLVPGFNADVTGDLDGLVGNARRLRNESITLARQLDPASSAAAVATVAWLGYRTPDARHIWFHFRAKAGGEALARFSTGIDDARQIARLARPGPADAHLVAAAHSYGSLALGYAMRKGAAFDDVIILGSPGTAERQARDLVHEPGHVYVAEAKHDPVADLAYFGSDPSSAHFGATQLHTDGGIDPLTGARLNGVTGHSGYFNDGSESLRNIATVTIDRSDLATYGDMSSFGDTARSVAPWLARTS